MVQTPRTADPDSPLRWPAFALTWGCLGFFLGTLTLMGPVRWLTTYARDRQWSQSGENMMVRTIIILLVIVSALLAWRLVAWAFTSAATRRRMTVPLVSALLAAASLALWMNPRLMAGTRLAPTAADTSRFVFGGYPTREILEDLKKEGFTGVITLLHPAVVPFEPRLLADERRAARDVGITLVEAPMLPWVSSNDSSLAMIRALAANPTGRYYVHCYLGKDRVNVVRRALEHTSVSVAGAEGVSAPRRLTDIARFERGPILSLGDSVFVIPFPTDEEWFGYLLSGWVKSIVSLLDPQNADNTPWITKEEQVVKQYGLTVTGEPVKTAADARRMQEIVDHVRRLPRPVAVHGFLVPSAETDAFIAAFRASSGAKASQ